jgi:predicted MPP superfamily phosphohydrolase
VLSDILGRISPVALAPAWLALAAISSWPWIGRQPLVAVVSLLFIVAEGIGLALLRRQGRSFGAITPPMLALALFHAGIMFVVGVLWPTVAGMVVAVVLNLGLASIFAYATWIEPFHIGITYAELHSPKLRIDRSIRLLHISDLHVERVTRRERDLVNLARKLAPDLVVLTGDYLNLSYVDSPHTHQEAHNVLAALCAAVDAPVFAVTGSPPVDIAHVVPRIFSDLPITWLQDDIHDVCLHDQVLRLAGIRCMREREIDVPRLRRLLNDTPPDQFTLLLYHSPDLMPEASELEVDLYLCGHTHGGQIRLPLVGALITSSAFWKRYEMGRYQEGHTTLYVSRGLGMEGLGAPRARFLAPPEVVVWTLSR